MQTLKFIGYSDDTFGEFNITASSVDNCASCSPVQCIIISGEQSVVIIGQYNRFGNGCWDIGICQRDEDIPIPDWKIRFSSEGYSAVLEIDVPDDFRLHWFDDGVEVTTDG